MKKTVVILGHPDMTRSVANKAIAEELQADNNITVRDITKLYPDFKIDVEAEQKALIDAENIVLQFPLQWFNMPGILKQWLDDTFARGFAHGSDGNKLKGKNLLISFTAGVAENFYKEGYQLKNFTDMFLHTAKYTGMNYLGAIYECEMMANADKNITTEDIASRARTQAKRILDTLA